MDGSPTLSCLSFTPEKPHHFVHIISNLLNPSECASVIASHNNLIPSNVTPLTIRTREVFDDPALAEKLWDRIRGFYETDKSSGRVCDEDGEAWVVSGLNERFRLCLYEQGGKFSPHTDGRRLASLNSQSFMTLNVYLNTVHPSAHGATRFLSSPSPSPSSSSTSVPHPPQTILASSPPVIGSAAVFRDDLWHDGEELLEGKKWLLRTDVMFTREKEFNWHLLCEKHGWGKEEKGRYALKLAEGLEDAGSSAEAVGWYKVAFREWPELERGG